MAQMINNFEAIEPFLNFESGSVVYQIEILQRTKDGNGKTGLVADFYVNSLNYYKFIQAAIKVLCKEYNARAYINLNPKSEEAILWKMMDSGMERLKNKQFKPLSLLTNAVVKCNAVGDKVWVVDIDEPSDIENIDNICNSINICRSGHSTNVLKVIPTVNGLHILTRPFNPTDLNFGLEIKKNAMTILFYE